MFELASGDFWMELVRQDEFTAVLAIALGCTVGVVAILATSICGVVKARAKETTRRELAAYVAEGTITPNDAVAMINAGRSRCEKVDVAEPNVCRA